MNGPELVGEDSCEDLLTSFSNQSRGPGRPSELEKECLLRAAQELQFVLEQNWGPVGGRLLDAKTLPAIRDAFHQVRHIQNARLDLFVFSETRKTTGNELRKLRRQVKRARTHFYEASIARRYAQDWYEKARQDCMDETDRARKSELDVASCEWLRKCHQADADMVKAEEHLTSITEQLRHSEAYFAQSEILDFIRTGRREFTPFNVASAMSGLPYLSARVSCERVWATNPQFTKGNAYLVFAAIRANFSECPSDLNLAIAQMREYLVEKSRCNLPHIAELRKNWYFLELSIRAVVRSIGAPRGSIPYNVFAEYRKRVECQLQGDPVLAETKRILTKDERPELENLPHWDEGGKIRRKIC